MFQREDRGAIGIRFNNDTKPVVSAKVTFGEFETLDARRRDGETITITDDKGVTRSYPADTINSFVFEANPPYYARR